MNARQKSSYMSLCFKNGIRIYPKVYARKKYKIVIERNGRAKEGKEIYPQDPEYNRETKETKPSVYQKIHQLYESIAENIKRNLNNNQNHAVL